MNRSRIHPRRPALAPAFTLVEMIVVIIMIAVLATVITPRMAGNNARQALAEADDLQRLLSVAAEKSLMSGQAIMLGYDGAAKRFELLVQRPPGAAASSASSSATPDDKPVWRPDPLVAPAAFTQAVVKQAFVDGRLMPAGGWRIAIQPGQPRPDIRVVIDPSGAGSGSSGQVAPIEIGLSPEGTAATRTGGPSGPGRPSAAGDAGIRVVDLDDTGRGEQVMVKSEHRVRAGIGSCAFALVDVIVATVLLGVSLAVIISLTGRSISDQGRGEELSDAAHLADEQLKLVLARGPDNYEKRFPVEGACDAPFDRFHYRLGFSAGTTGEPYRVAATIQWQSGVVPHSLTIETLVATRDAGQDGDPDPIRKPDQSVIRTQ